MMTIRLSKAELELLRAGAVISHSFDVKDDTGHITTLQFELVVPNV